AAGWRPRQGLSARRERRDRGAADGGGALAVARAAALGARRLGARRRPALVRRPPGAPRRLRRPRADGPSRGAAGLRFGDGVFPRGTGGHHQRGPTPRRQARRGRGSGRGRGAGPERARRGGGFDVAAVRRGTTGDGSIGLDGMEERVRLLGGEFRIDTHPGTGTTVWARFPLTEP